MPLARRAEPLQDFCQGHAWIGRFCSKHPDDGREIWIDLCWRIRMRFANPLHPPEPIYVAPSDRPSWRNALANGLELEPLIDSMLFDQELLNHDRIPYFQGRSFTSQDFACPALFICVQALDTDRDAHVFCIRDEPSRGERHDHVVQAWEPRGVETFVYVRLDRLAEQYDLERGQRYRNRGRGRILNRPLDPLVVSHIP